MDLKEGDTVIVGMDGGVESTVAAYLLKKQGLYCIGVCVVYHEDDSEFEDIISSWLPDKLENIKKICQILDVVFYATNASDLYYDRVIDSIVSARLIGGAYEPLPDRTAVILETLHLKKEELKAQAVATGHYCKVLKNQTTGIMNIFSSNDIEEDDSFYISKVPYKILSDLKFPMADLKKVDIDKLAKVLPIKFTLDREKRRKDRISFMENDQLYKIVEKYSPLSLREKGSVLSYYNNATIGDHIGIHQFHLGQRTVPLKIKIPIDKELEVVQIIMHTGTIFMEKSGKIFFTHLYGTSFVGDESLNKSVPLHCYVILGARKKKKSCTLFFKSNDAVVIVLDEKMMGSCGKGQYVCFYNKKGQGARVLGGSIVKKTGYHDEEGEYRSLPMTKKDEDFNQEVEQKKNDLGF